MNCSKCLAKVPADKKFCVNCGSKLEKEPPRESAAQVLKFCPDCGTENKLNKKFCTNCGAQLSKSQSQQGAKRKSKPQKNKKSSTFPKLILVLILLAAFGYGGYYLFNEINFNLNLFPKYNLVYGANVPIKIHDEALIEKEITAKEIKNYKDLPSPKNSKVLSAVVLKPEGLEIPNGVSVSFPLDEKLKPGMQLPIGYFDEKGDRWLETSGYCYVDPSGMRANGTVYHFSIFGPFRSQIYLQERKAYHTEWMWILSQYGRMLDELNVAITEKYRSPLGIPSESYVEIDSWLDDSEDRLTLITMNNYEMLNFRERGDPGKVYWEVINTDCLAAARAEYGSRKKKLDKAFEAAYLNWYKAASEENVNSIVALWAASADLLTFKQQKYGSLSSRAYHYFKLKFIDAYVDLIMDFLKEKGNKVLEYFFKGKDNAASRDLISTVSNNRIGAPVKKKALEYLSGLLIDVDPNNLESMSKNLMIQADTLAFKLSGVLNNSFHNKNTALQGDIAKGRKYHTSQVLLYAYPYLLNSKRQELTIFYSPYYFTLTAEEIEDSYGSRVYRNHSISNRVIELNIQAVQNIRRQYREYKTKLKDEIGEGIIKWNELDEFYQSDDEAKRLSALVANRLLKHDIDKFLGSNLDRFFKKHFIKFLTGNLEVPYLKETTGLEVPNVREIGIEYLVNLLFKGANNLGKIVDGVKKVAGLFGSVFEDGLTVAWDYVSPDKVKQLNEELDKKSVRRALAIKPLEVDKVFKRDKDLFDVVEISVEYPDACPPPEWKVLINGDFHFEIDKAFDTEKEEYYSLYTGGEAKADNEALKSQGIDQIKVMLDVGLFGRDHSINTYKGMIEYYDKEHKKYPEDLERYTNMGVEMTNWSKKELQGQVGTHYTKISYGRYGLHALYVIGATIVEIRVWGTSNNQSVVKARHDQILNRLKTFNNQMRAGRNPYDVFGRRFPGEENPFLFTLTEEELKERGLTR